jgi:putative ABC transport system substrate-binding protein
VGAVAARLVDICDGVHGMMVTLLQEAIPRLSRAGVLIHGGYAAARREAEAGGKALGITLQIVTVNDAGELERAFSAFHAERAQGVVLVRDAFMGVHIKTLVDLALKHRLPTISDVPFLAARGGLISYGYNVRDAVRSAAADIVDKILRGAKASEIPIQQATTFRLVINLGAPKVLGMTIPPSLALRADEVIR